MGSRAGLHVGRFWTTDIDRLIAISEASKLSPWSKQGFLDHLKDASALSIALTEDDGVLVGYLVARLVPGSNGDPDAELLNLAVCEPYRRGGGGTKLMESFLSWCNQHHVARIWLEVRESNFTAQKFYERFDFKCVGQRKNFYAMPVEDASIMCRKLA